jgi:hypothetical protein
MRFLLVNCRIGVDTTAVYIRPSMEKLDVDVEEGGK